MSGPAEPVPQRRRDPVRLLLSADPWSAALLLLTYIVVGTVLFVVTLTVSMAAVGLSITLLGIPLFVVVAELVLGCAALERGRIALIRSERIGGTYQPVSWGGGILAALRTRWTDRATWHAVAYFVVLYLPLLLLDTVVFTVWLGLLGGVTVPLWYRFVPQTFPNGEVTHGISLGYFPNGPHGPGGTGFWIGDLSAALVTAVISLALLVLVANYLVVGTANLHVRIARRLLGPPVDPLAAAKAMLAPPAARQDATTSSAAPASHDTPELG